jgi:RHS repeat-associated protein
MNRYEATGELVYEYDDDGNVTMINDTTGGPVTTFTYNTESQLVEIDDGTDVRTFTYDGLGRCVGRTVNGVATEYLVAPLGMREVLAEYDGTGVLSASYSYGGVLLARQAGSETQHYTFTERGDTVLMTGTGGAVANRYTYTPFGTRLVAEETVPNPFQYVGAYGVMNHGGGCLHMRARFYNPDTGRFLSTDPEEPGTTDNYGYAINNPVTYIDPFGLRSASCKGFRYGMQFRSFGRLRDRMQGTAWKHRLNKAIGDLARGTEKVMKAAEGGGELVSNAAKLAGAKGRFIAGMNDGSQKLAKKTMSALQRCFQRAYMGRIDHCTLSMLDGAIPKSAHRRLRRALEKVAATRRKKEGDDKKSSRGRPADAKRTASAGSKDPNQKIGPGGVGGSRFVRPGATLAYQIDFENDPTALAPAQKFWPADDYHQDYYQKKGTHPYCHFKRDIF